MTKYQAKIIMAYANNDMNVKLASKELWMSDGNVGYHLTKIRKQMGFDPRKFFDLCYLVGVAQQRIGGNDDSL